MTWRSDPKVARSVPDADARRAGYQEVPPTLAEGFYTRSEERRVGKEC